MKNKNLLKVFGITLLVTFILTWVIPSTTIGTDGLVTGAITPTGFADIFATFDILLYYFAQPAVLILLVGALYGIINKTGAFKATVKKLASIFNKKGFIFLIITVVFYATTTALTGMYMPMFIFMPLSIAVLLNLKYSKVESILATVGASTIGLLSIMNSTEIASMTGAEGNTYLWVKVGLLAVLIALVILYIIFMNKKHTKEDLTGETIMFIPSDRSADKKVKSNGVSLLIIFGLMFVVLVLGFTPWNAKIAEAFSNAYTAIKSVKIGNFAIFNSILGYFETFGSWTYASLYPTIGLAIIVAALIGKLSFKESIEAIIEGLKKLAGLALLVTLINIVLIFSLNSGAIGTIVKFILAKENIALTTIGSLVGNLFMVTDMYSAQYVVSLIYYSFADTNLMELYGMIVQFTFGFISLIAPTSLLLMAGLYYTEEEYKKWFKYVWKLLVAIFVAMLIAILVATML